MKFGTIAGLLSVATAAEMTPENEHALEEKDFEMQQLCENMGDIANEDDLELEEGEEADKKKYIKKVKSSYKKHYGLTKAQIDKENNHILNTQATCMRFVKKYRGHPKVCNWCKHAKAPKVIWKWDAKDKVWFRWYMGKWHYWGPSKHGFTAKGWTWYKGYWHHNGWVFKYVNHMWYRFQARKWVKYARRIDINPTPPRGPKICRPFYMLKKWGFPTSLATKSLPRCKVGNGKKAIWYMWKDRKNCRFLGGKLVYQRIKLCKTGRPHTWAKVTRCVQGPILSKKGLNYKTGLAYKISHTKRVHKSYYIGGLKMGNCYKFRAYSKHKDYMANQGTYAFNSPYSRINVWKIAKGMDGSPNTITIQDRTGRYGARLYSRDRVRFYWNKWLSKKSATMYVLHGLAGKGISFMPKYKKGYFLRHEPSGKQIHFRRYNGKSSFKKAATWFAIKARC